MKKKRTTKPPAYLLDRFYDHVEKDRGPKMLRQIFVNKFLRDQSKREQERKNLPPDDGKVEQ